MPCKVTVYYNQAAKGWTETYYVQSDEPVSIVNTFSQKKNLSRFISFRCFPAYIHGIKATLLGNDKQSYAQNFLTPGYYAAAQSTDAQDPDLTSTSAMIYVQTSGGKKQRIYVRGLRDEDVERYPTGADKPSANLVAGLSSMAAALVDCGVVTRSLKVPIIGGPAWRRVVSITEAPDNPNATVLTFKSNPVFSPTQRLMIWFRGVPKNDVPGFPNPAQVLSATTSEPWSITIPYRFRAHTTSVFPANMVCTPVEYDFTPLVKFWEFSRFTEHKTGRPFGVSPGRRQSLVKRF